MGSYNALSLAPGASIRLSKASHWYPLRNFQTNLGWLGASTSARDNLDISFVLPSTEEVVAQSVFTFTRMPVPVFIPYKPDALTIYDLIIRAPATNAEPVILGVMQNITHDKFYALAAGKGIEIGPGPNPRVKQSDTTNVTYLERYGQETYLKYNHGYSPILQDTESLWKSYRVGSAHEIPDDLGELDFIFSAHMIEHLPNPLGHFRLWHSRLSEKGRVLGIVPALKGCFDLMFNEPTTLNEWVSLLDTDLSRPQPWQYDKYIARYKRTREIWSLRTSDPTSASLRRKILQIF